ncbi:CD209 antigen-like protein C [Embiotoca jacksoni]|uniref:CD209 antigen-like protein C n=1 Tax=Embiotoca jacksoni TaxID=100190 RepID=UPI003703DE98
MEDIYVNVEDVSSVKLNYSRNQPGPRSTKKSFHLGVIVSLGLLSVFLLAGLITLGVHYRHSAAGLPASEDRLSSMTEERDLLNTSLTEMTKQLDRIRTQSTEKKTCPEGWTIFRVSCYRLSELSGSWDTGRRDCRDKAAHLVVIESPEEQEFLSTFTKLPVWIGLNDNETEGTWKWIDGTPLTFMHWETNQPDEWLPHAGGEDCAHITEQSRQWNDASCKNSMNWICEETAKSCFVF